MSNSDHPFRFFFYFGVPVLSSDAKRGGIGECGCLQQVLFGAPELFCKHSSLGPVMLLLIAFIYSATLRSSADSHLSCCMWLWMCDCRFFYLFYYYFLTAPFSRFTEVLYLQRCLVVACLVPRETAGVSARSVQTIQLCTMSRHFMQSHILRAHVCLALTCHLQFWQNGQIFHVLLW